MSGVFSRRTGEPFGFNLMKFTLTYDGKLSANGGKREKWAMRQQFHPQTPFERRRRCPTDLTDAEWQQIRLLLPKPARRGRRPKVALPEILNAIRCMARLGGGWRMLPVRFGPWQTVCWWFCRLVRRLLFRTVHDVMLMLDREQAGCEASPTAGVADSRTVKAPHASGGGGYDAARKLKGRKRHVAVDTDGRLPMVNLSTADVQDAAGAEEIIKGVRRRWPWLKHLFADGAHDLGRLASLAAYKDFTLEIVRRLPEQKGFQVLPRRWVAERTFGWMTRRHRLVRGCEVRMDVSDAMIHLSKGALLLRRVAHPDT